MKANALHSKILYSLLAVMTATALVPLMIVSWRLIAANEDNLTANAQTVMTQRTRGYARRVAAYIDGYAAQTTALARALEMTGIDQLSRKESGGIAEIQRRDEDVIALAVVPASGAPRIERNAPRATPDQLAIVDETVAEATGHPLDRVFVGKVRRVGNSQTPIVAVADSVVIDGKNVATVVTVVDITSALAFVTPNAQAQGAVPAPDESVAFVVDESGATLAHTDPDAGGGRSMRDVPIVSEWLGSDSAEPELAREFSILSGSEHANVLGTLVAVPMSNGQHLAAVMLTDQSAVVAPARSLAWRALWATAFAAFVTVLAAFLFAGQIARPIRALARGAREIASGNFSHRIHVRSHNETGLLADDFNLMADRLDHYVEQLRKAAETNRALFIGTVRALAAAIDGKDPYTRGHSERVAEYSAAMAVELGLPDEEVEKIRIGGLMHDLGKLAIEDRILRKPAALTDEEFEIMREHPERGTKIMAEIPQMREYIPGMRFHHEMVNGKGYPLGLEGDQIPMMARIVGVADTFDAMTTNRPYQKEMQIDVVFDRIRSFSGVRYDPHVVDALVAAYEHGRIRLKRQRAASARPAAEEQPAEATAGQA